MTTISFKDFMKGVILEELHPEIHKVITTDSNVSKQTRLANKIKELSAKGESTGIEGNMPKGSSRAYLQHAEVHNVVIDGKPATIKTGTKVAIKAQLDAHHDKSNHDGLNLGQMQNKAEGGDWYVNNSHRVLSKDHDTGHYHTNEDGIFPPLIDHDHDNHHWTQVGHARDIKKTEFKDLTKTDDHPNGISHDDFTEALVRFHDRNNGKSWARSNDAHLDRVEEHPLVQKFITYHGNTGAPPHDLRQLKNMGVWEHPNGSKHIVARDHGFDTEVEHAYSNARKTQNQKYRDRY